MQARLIIVVATLIACVAAQSCQPYTALMSLSGTVSVGTPGTQYSDETSCLWLIDLSSASPPVTSITVTFTRLDTEFYYDYVAFFDGNFSGIAFKALSGQPSTPPATFSSKGNVVGVWFYADEALSFSGFSFNYVGAQCGTNNCNGPDHGFCGGQTCLCNDGWTGAQCETPTCGLNNACGNVGTCVGTTCQCPDTAYGPTCSSNQCQQGKVLTGQSGTFFDHIGDGNYQPDRKCSWLIQPSPPVQSISLRFDEFSTEDDYDYVVVYSGVDSNGILLGNFSGSLSANAPELVAVGGSVYIEFTSDQYVEEPGFQITWEGVNCSSDCSGHGRCFGGSCLCDLGWSGAVCDQSICSNNCSGHGTCQSNVCVCDAGWTSQADCGRCTDSACLTNVGFCSGNQNLRGPTGIIQDNNSTASAIGAYCTWYITAVDENGYPYDSMTLEWEFFDLDPQEAEVLVYDTALSQRPQGVFTGLVTPSPVHSPGNTMLVLFLTSSTPSQPTRGGFIASWQGYNCTNSCSGNGQCVAGTCECEDGWSGAACDVQECAGNPPCSGQGQCVATAAGSACRCNLGAYGADCSSSFCDGVTSVTLDQANMSVTLQDHGGGNFYKDFSNCGWSVQASSPLTAAFSEFQLFTRCPFGASEVTTVCSDYLVVYDGPDSNSPVIDVYGGYDVPAPIRSTGNALYFKFITSSSEGANGFTALVSLANSCGTCTGGFCSGTKCLCPVGSSLDASNTNCVAGLQAATDMQLNVKYNGTVPAFTWAYYKFTPSRAADTLVWTLNTPNVDMPGEVWLLIRANALPDTNSYDYVNTAGTANRQIASAGVAGTTYYAAVYGTYTPSRGYSLSVSVQNGTPGPSSTPGPTTLTTAPSTTGPRGGGGSKSNNGARAAAIIGAIVLSLIILTVVALMVFYVYKRRKAGPASGSPAPDNSPPPRSEVDLKQFRNNNPDA